MTDTKRPARVMSKVTAKENKEKAEKEAFDAAVEAAVDKRLNRTEIMAEGKTPTRVSVRDQARDILTIFGKKDPNKYYRVVKDEPGRIQMFQNAGYKIVTAGEGLSIGVTTTSTATNSEGSPLKLYLKGTDENGNKLYGYLMWLDMELYLMDQAQKQRDVDETEAGLNKDATLYDKGSMIDHQSKH